MQRWHQRCDPFNNSTYQVCVQDWLFSGMPALPVATALLNVHLHKPFVCNETDYASKRAAFQSPSVFFWTAIRELDCLGWCVTLMKHLQHKQVTPSKWPITLVKRLSCTLSPMFPCKKTRWLTSLSLDPKRQKYRLGTPLGQMTNLTVFWTSLFQDGGGLLWKAIGSIWLLSEKRHINRLELQVILLNRSHFSPLTRSGRSSYWSWQYCSAGHSISCQRARGKTGRDRGEWSHWYCWRILTGSVFGQGPQ